MANGDALYAANPYKNQTYNRSPWQKFLTSLGFRTQADAWEENMSVQAAEYDAAVAQKLHDQEYEDPVNQVARMRQAGLNPDIDGGSTISSGSAGEMGEDPSTPMQSSGDDVQIASFANGVLSAFSTALGLVNGVQGVVRNRIQNSILSLQGETGFSEAARNFAIQLLPNTPDSLFDESGEMVSDWRSNALGSAKLFAKNFPRKMQSKFLNEIEHFWNTAPTTKEAYKEWSDRVSARKDYVLNSQTFYSEVNDLLFDITKPLAEMSEKIYNKKQDAEFAGYAADDAEAQKREEIALNIDGTLAAETENAQNRASKGMANIQDSLRSTMNRIMHNLEKSSKEGGFKGSLSQFMLIMMCMQQMQMLPSASSVVGLMK